MSDEQFLEVMDPQGNLRKISRDEFARESMKAARANWDNIDAVREIRSQMLQGGFFNEALELATRAGEISNAAVQDMFFRGIALIQLKRYDEAETVLEEIREDAAYPADIARATAALARIRAEQGRPEEADALLDEAIDADPDSPGPMIDLFEYRNMNGAPEKAVVRLREIADRLPGAAAPRRALAHAAFRMQDVAMLKTESRAAVERANAAEITEVLGQVSSMLGQAGQPADIVALLEPRRNDIRDAAVFLNLAQAFSEVGRTTEARNLLMSLRNGAPPNFQTMIDQRIAQLAT